MRAGDLRNRIDHSQVFMGSDSRDLLGPERAEVGDSEDWPGRSGKSPPLTFCPGTGFSLV